MKRLLLSLLSIIGITVSIMAQDVMVIEKTDNTSIRINVNDIKRAYFETAQEQQQTGVTITPCTETGGSSSTGVSNLTSNSVTISAKVTIPSEGYYQYNIYIGKDKTVSSSNYIFYKSGIDHGSTIISEIFTELSSNTTYYYIITLTHLLNANKVYGTSDVISFTTLNDPTPTVIFTPCTDTGGSSTTGVTDVTSNSVTISTNITGLPDGIYTYIIYIGTNRTVSPSNYLYYIEATRNGSIISGKYTGLSGNTTYYYVIVITNTLTRKKYTSEVISFVTPSDPVPTPSFLVGTKDVTNIGETTARVNAEFIIKNAAKKYRVGFFVSTNSIPTSDNSKNYYYEYEYANCDDVVSIDVSGLTPGTKYYVKPYILYDGEYVYGPRTDFTTKVSAPTLNVTTKETTDIGETTATINAKFTIKNAAKKFRLGFFVSSNSTPSASNSKNYYYEYDEVNYDDQLSIKVTGLEAGTKYYVRPYILYDGKYEYGTITNFTTKTSTPTPVPNSTKGTLAGHDWVDLGLPSGTKWATCNIGASKPENYGDYYAWGETSPKTNYSPSNYKNKDNHILSDISGTSYDVAHVKWGSSWRMAKLEEWDELVENCSAKTETKNGVKGTRYTGKNGNSIFLPWAGYREGTKLKKSYWNISNEMEGHYFTSYGDAPSVSYAWLSGYGNAHDLCLSSCGLSIRAVWK